MKGFLYVTSKYFVNNSHKQSYAQHMYYYNIVTYVVKSKQYIPGKVRIMVSPCNDISLMLMLGLLQL